MIIKCLWVAMIIAGFLIGVFASLGFIKFYWAILGAIFVATGMVIRQFGSIERA
ncbi:hypothetical protein [Aeromonas veronii]|uniref:hypothetical protein n=1 Tax=Aeromonas veronii TaxID=654 RepID=UPI0015F06B04|nr:hypothetical protein [Aeromonas veronii]